MVKYIDLDFSIQALFYILSFFAIFITSILIVSLFVQNLPFYIKKVFEAFTLMDIVSTFAST